MALARQDIKALSFDLDDTLWDNTGVIERSQRACYDFLCAEHPPFAEHVTLAEFSVASARQGYQDSVFENMTHLRKAVIRQLLDECGGDRALVNPAFGVFFRQRCQVEVTTATRQLLSELQLRWPLVAISNGNSDIHRVGIANYFEMHLIAGMHGRAKPHPEMFERAAQKLDLACEQILHIGDVWETDVAGALASGAVPVWLTDPANPWPKNNDSMTERVIRIAALDELKPLLLD